MQRSSSLSAELSEEELMEAGHAANAKGNMMEALQFFNLCYEKGSRMEARISAANMCLKIGQQPGGDAFLITAVEEYQNMLRQLQDLSISASPAARSTQEKLENLLLRKYRQAVDEAKKRRDTKKVKEYLMRKSIPAGSINKTTKNTAPAMSDTVPSGEQSARLARSIVRGGDELQSRFASRANKSSGIERGTLRVVVKGASDVPRAKKHGLGLYLNFLLDGTKRKAKCTKRADHVYDFLFASEALQWHGELHELVAEQLVFKLKDKEVFSRNDIGEGRVDLIDIAAAVGSKIHRTVEVVELGAAQYGGIQNEHAARSYRCMVDLEIEWRRDHILGSAASSTDEPAVLHIGTTILKPVEDRLPGTLPPGYYDNQPSRATSRTPKRECSMLDPFSWSDFLCVGSRS